MNRVFARVNFSRKDPKTYGKVDIQIRDVPTNVAPAFTTTSLTHQHWCIVPVFVDGVEALCGKPLHAGTHGWFCQYHYMRSLAKSQYQPTEDADTIKFIIGSERQKISSGEGVRLGPFKGLTPLMVPDRHPMYEPVEETIH